MSTDWGHSAPMLLFLWKYSWWMGRTGNNVLGYLCLWHDRNGDKRGWSVALLFKEHKTAQHRNRSFGLQCLCWPWCKLKLVLSACMWSIPISILTLPLKRIYLPICPFSFWPAAEIPIPCYSTLICHVYHDTMKHFVWSAICANQTMHVIDSPPVHVQHFLYRSLLPWKRAHWFIFLKPSLLHHLLGHIELYYLSTYCH